MEQPAKDDLELFVKENALHVKWIREAAKDFGIKIGYGMSQRLTLAVFVKV